MNVTQLAIKNRLSMLWTLEHTNTKRYEVAVEHMVYFIGPESTRLNQKLELIMSIFASGPY